MYDIGMGDEPFCDPDDADPTDGDPMHAATGELAGQLNVVHARLSAHLAELLADDGWQVGGMKSPVQYLVWKAGLAPHTARLVVEVARRRDDFPVIMGLFDAGQLSLDQVAVAVEAPAWADAQFAHFCRISTVPKLRRALRSDMFTGDPDDPEPPPAPPRDRVSFGVRDGGRWRLSAELDIDAGRRVEAALFERRDALYGEGDEEVTWADAFVDCAERSLDAVESPARRDRYRTWLHVDVTDGSTTSTDGWRIPMAIRDRLLCDGVVQPVWESEGVPFSVGRAQHIVPGRTRRVVERRDRGCRVPGCSADRFVEIHHIRHWLDGGTTDTFNLVSLCPRHHRMHHQGLLGISGDADEPEGLVFTDAEGRVIASRGDPVIPTGPPPSPSEPYQNPLNGRYDWSYFDGWEHPNATKQRVAEIRRRSDAYYGRN